MGRKRGDYTQAERCFLIINRLRGMPEGVFMKDLAEEMDTDRRQIERDLQALERGGFHCEIKYRDQIGPTGATRAHAVAVLVEPPTSQVTLTRQERFTILAVRQVFDVLKGTPFYTDMRRVCDKLTQCMPRKDRDELATLGDRFVYVPDAGMKQLEDEAPAMLETLRTAVMNRRVVRYEYRRASGRPEQGYLAPYAMVLYRGGLYVVGRRVASPEEATTPAKPGCLPTHPYAAERFTAVELTDGLTGFEVPRDLKLDRLFHGAFGIFIGAAEPQRVVIEFSRSKAALALARKWNPSQEPPERLPDGRVRLAFMLRDLKEMKSWIMSWGRAARVIEPAALAAEVAQELSDAAESYALRRAALGAVDGQGTAVAEKQAAA